MVKLRQSERKSKKPDLYTPQSSFVTTPKVVKVKNVSLKRKLSVISTKNASVLINAVPQKSKKISKKKNKDKQISKPKPGKLRDVSADKTKPKHPNDKLRPKPQVTVFGKDPTFELKEELPFISADAYSKLAIRAVYMDNPSLLKRLIDDTKHVSSVHKARSIDNPKSALQYAIEKENWKMVDMLFGDIQKPKQNRIQELPSLLASTGTGSYNFYMLGHAVRPIQMARGGKEGNNALLKESPSIDCYDMKFAVRKNVSISLLQHLITKEYISTHHLPSLIQDAVRYGNRKLAGKLIQLYASFAFNDLHQEVLLNDKQNLKQFKSVSVKKKGLNVQITPLHCACINPNLKYLEELIKSEPDYNHPDADNRRPLHYAAACEGSEPLQLLLAKGCSPFDVDKQGNSALHIAAETGRAENIKVLAKKIKENDPSLAYLNSKTRQGVAALHIAAENGHLEAVKALLEQGANVDIQSGAAKGKKSALMFAAQAGHLAIVKHLMDKHNAIVDGHDKLKRTALLHGVVNGMGHVVSYLLRTGSNPDLPDSSGNTPSHYAAAYGWYFCLQLLIKAGAELNKANDWQLTPLAVAYMKGHMGLVDLLLEQERIDINCQDEKGMSLVALTVTSAINKSTPDQLSYLIKDKRADCTLSDSMGNNPLHHLATATYQHFIVSTEKEKQNEELKVIIEIAKLLIDHGCDINQLNMDKKTPMVVAIEVGKMQLAEFILNKGGSLPEDNMELNRTENVLHFLAKGKCSNVSASLFSALAMKQAKVVEMLLDLTDAEGYSPFLKACQIYSSPKKFSKNIQFTKSEVADARKNILLLIKEIIVFKPICLKHTVEIETNTEENVADNDDDDDVMESNSSDDSDQDEETEDKQSEPQVKKNPNQIDVKRLKTAGQTAVHLAVIGDRSQCEVKKGQILEEKPLLGLILRIYTENKDKLATKNKKSILDILDANHHTALMTAVSNSDSTAAVILIQAGADVNAVVIRPQKQPNLKAAVSDLQQENQQEHKKEPPDNITVLMEAVGKGLNAVVIELLAHGTDITCTDSNGDTALHYAATNPSSEMADIVKTLLINNASPHAVNAKNRTPLHIACNCDMGSADISTETTELLLKYGAKVFAKDCRSRLPLHYAFVKIGKCHEVSPIDPIALCQVLLSHMKRTSHESSFLIDTYGKTPLHYAAMRGSNICCLTILHQRRNVLDVIDKEGNTALGLAVFYKHMPCALTLIQGNAEINFPIHKIQGKYESHDQWLKQNKWKWSPLRDSLQMSKMTIPSGMVQNEWQGMVFVILDLLEKTPDILLWLGKAAVEHRKYNLALNLIRIAKAKANPMLFSKSHDAQDNLFLLFAKTAHGDKSQESIEEKVAQALLLLGVPYYDSFSLNNSLPAIEAAKNHNFVLLQFFENNHPKREEFLPNAVSDSHTVFTALFYKNGASTLNTQQCRQWQKHLYQKNMSNSVNNLASFHKPGDWTDPHGRPAVTATGAAPISYIFSTPLIQAVVSQNFDLCKYLINELNADINKPDINGSTPLMHAVKINNTGIVYLLLNNEYELTNKKDSKKQNSEDDEENMTERIFGVGSVPLPKSQFSGNFDTLTNSSIHNNQDEDRKEVSDSGEESSDYVPSPKKAKVKSRMKKQAKRKLPHASIKVQEFKKTSNVDLTVKDLLGQTVLHYCVNSGDWGGWENVDLAKMLIKFGANPLEKDNHQKTVLDYAIESGQQDMQHTFCTEMGHNTVSSINSTKIEIFPITVMHDSTSSAISVIPSSTLNGNPDIDKDAAEFLAIDAKIHETKIKNQKGPEAAEKWALVPHFLSSYNKTGEIVKCQKTNHLYKVLLNKVDVKYGLYGFYNFYRLQLIQRKGSQLYIVFTNWGRIGDDGQYQRTPFGKLEDAEKEFCSIFKSKTGNDWLQMPNFKIIPTKYKLIQQDQDNLEASNLAELEIDLDSQVQSKLPENLKDLVMDLSNVKALKDNTKAVASRNNMLLPFGRLKRDTILEARNILREIQENIMDINKMRDDQWKEHERKSNQEKCERIMNDLADLSNKFYQLIPFGGMQHCQLQVIDNMQLWESFMKVVHNLLEFEVAGKILAGASLRKNQIHPFDYIYSSLGCNIQLLNSDENEAQFILHYIHNTSPSTAIQAVYKIAYRNETNDDMKHRNELGNRMYLWHGTAASNLLSIFKLGLLTAPPQTLHHGYLFGQVMDY